MTLRARWIGPPPRVGDYLAAPRRPRYAYRVTQVRNASSKVYWDLAARAEMRCLAFDVVRIVIDRLPLRARVHTWTWDRRASRAASQRRSA